VREKPGDALSPSTVVVVGAGIAGVACARVLTRAGLDVVVLDKGRRAGGRMARWTRDGRAIDIGAAYFTVRDPAFAVLAEQWASRGLAHPWTDTFTVAEASGARRETSGPVRWSAEGGLRSLVEDLAGGLDVRLGHEVISVGTEPGGRPRVDGQPVRAVVLAMPDPQVVDLVSGDLAADAGLDDEWHPVITVAAGFDQRTWATADGLFVHDSAVSLLVDDGRRRGDGAPVLVAHCTHEVAAANLDTPDVVVPGVLAEMARLVPGLGDPAWVEVKRWGSAEPRRPRSSTFYLGEAAVAICGDGWSQRPRIEAAWRSGRDAGHALAARLR
jgi:hypothetical protein